MDNNNAPARAPKQENAPRLLYDRKTAAQHLSISVRSLDSHRCVLIAHAELHRLGQKDSGRRTRSDAQIVEFMDHLQSAYADGTLQPWQIRTIERAIPSWRWNSEYGSKAVGSNE